LRRLCRLWRFWNLLRERNGSSTKAGAAVRAPGKLENKLN